MELIQIDNNPNSVTHWFIQLRKQDPRAAQELWNRLFQRLAAIAKSKIRTARLLDHEDLAIGVMTSLYQSAERGTLPSIHDRKDLWRILLARLRNDCLDQARHDKAIKRGGQFHQLELDQILSYPSKQSEGAPDIFVELQDHYDHLIQMLPNDQLRSIAIEKLRGLSNDEIACKLEVTSRTIQRKLSLIWTFWQGYENVELT